MIPIIFYFLILIFYLLYYIITERTSIEYEGSSDSIQEVHLNKNKATERRDYLQSNYGKHGFKTIEYFIDSYNVIE